MTPAEAEQYRATIERQLGFDPLEAVQTGIRRGWIQLPGAEPSRTDTLQDSVGEDCLLGMRAAGDYLGRSASWVSVQLDAGTLICEHRGRHTVFRKAVLDDFRERWIPPQGREGLSTATT